MHLLFIDFSRHMNVSLFRKIMYEILTKLEIANKLVSLIKMTPTETEFSQVASNGKVIKPR